jgi:hypothetical protein
VPAHYKWHARLPELCRKAQADTCGVTQGLLGIMEVPRGCWDRVAVHAEMRVLKLPQEPAALAAGASMAAAVYSCNG